MPNSGSSQRSLLVWSHLLLFWWACYSFWTASRDLISILEQVIYLCTCDPDFKGGGSGPWSRDNSSETMSSIRYAELHWLYKCYLVVTYELSMVQALFHDFNIFVFGTVSQQQAINLRVTKPCICITIYVASVSVRIWRQPMFDWELGFNINDTSWSCTLSF